MATEPQIINFYNNKEPSLSKMNKPDLYKKCQELIRENMKLQMINNVQQEEIETLKKSQICCDCQVGGECEAPGNCANGKRIEKLQEEIEKQLKALQRFSEIYSEEVDEQVELKKQNEKLQQELEELKSLYPRENKEYIGIAKNCSDNIHNKYICGNNHWLFDPTKKLEIPDCVGILFEPFIKLMITREKEYQQEIEDMKNDEKQFQIIEDLTEKLGDEVQKNIDLEKNYECIKSRHIECVEKLEIMNWLDEFVDSAWSGDIDWFNQEVMERFCDDTLEHFPDNKELFLKSILCKYGIYCDKLYTCEELEQFCVECQEEDGNEDFDIEIYSEEEVIDYMEGQCSYIYKCEIEEVKYYVLFE